MELSADTHALWSWNWKRWWLCNRYWLNLKLWKWHNRGKGGESHYKINSFYIAEMVPTERKSAYLRLYTIPLTPNCTFLTGWISESKSSASTVVPSSGMCWICGSGSQSCFDRHQRRSEVAAVHQWKRHVWDAHVSRRPNSAPPVQHLQTDHLPHPRVQAHGIATKVAVHHHRAAAGQGGHESHRGGLEQRSGQRELFQSSGKHTHGGWQPHCVSGKAEGVCLWRRPRDNHKQVMSSVTIDSETSINSFVVVFFFSFRKMAFPWAPFTWSESVSELIYQDLLVPVWTDP